MLCPEWESVVALGTTNWRDGHNRDRMSRDVVTGIGECCDFGHNESARWAQKDKNVKE